MGIHFNGVADFLKRSKTRRITPLAHVKAELLRKGPPRDTGQRVTALDGTRYHYFSDGSLRRVPPRLRGRAVVKRAKR